jgi:hypothetical protein
MAKKVQTAVQPINAGIYSGATSASLNLTGLHQLKRL